VLSTSLSLFSESSVKSWKQGPFKIQKGNRPQNKSVSNPVLNDIDGEQALNQAIRHISRLELMLSN